jgi:phospholipase C
MASRRDLVHAGAAVVFKMSRFLSFAVLLPATISIAHGQQATPKAGLEKISHIIVLYLENRSFNNLMGDFPGANGVARARSIVQRDKDGKPYEKLPPATGPFDVEVNPQPIRDLPMSPDLPNAPFAIDKMDPGATIAVVNRALAHVFYKHRAQINGGANDRFAVLSDALGFTMGYYSADAMGETNLWKAARRGILFDNFFQGAFGGSFLNHIWLVCACPPVWPHPPDALRSGFVGGELKDGHVTLAADGDYAVNTTQSIFLNSGKQHPDALLPAQVAITIGDRLSQRGVDWAWYSEGWNLAIAQNRTKEQQHQLEAMRFSYHHQPFAYYTRFDPATAGGRAERRKHLRDGSDLEADIQSGHLPSVAFYKPANVNTEHPGESTVAAGDKVIGQIGDWLDKSPMRDSYALIITYDEFGGFFDHVPPPGGPAAGKRADFFGPGSRIPTILVSPFVKGGTIDSRELETTSILKFIAERFQLDPLPSPRFGAVSSFSSVFDLPAR